MTSFYFTGVRHSKGLWFEVYVTKTYSLTENLPCGFGMQYTKITIPVPTFQQNY